MRKGRFRVRKVSRSGSQDYITPQQESNCEVTASPAKNSKLASSLILPSEKELEVKIYDVTKLFEHHYHEGLAQAYTLDEDPRQTCLHNSNVAIKHNQPKLAKAWSLCHSAAVLAFSMMHNQNFAQLWESHPFGGKMVAKLINFYQARRNFQMVAMIVCAFSPMMTKRVNSFGASSNQLTTVSSYASLDIASNPAALTNKHTGENCKRI